MLVLVADDNRFEREAATRLLEHASYRVEAVQDARSALDAIERDRHPIVLLAWRARWAADFLKQLRSSEADSHAYVLVALDSNSAGDVAALYGAGADDFMRRPVLREEFLGRIEALARIRKWSGASAAHEVSPGAKDLGEYTAIRNAGPLVAKDVAEMIGQEASVAEGWNLERSTLLRGATIPMSLATDKTELRVSVLVDEASWRALGGVLLGDPSAPDEALGDVLRE
ncbi:MAG TPA: response regulator, partial [Polyangiaceae bacterium]|nr:response regulator [Polyangiaceae bacterium]